MSLLIGDTPLIKIYYEYKQRIRYVYIKLEYYNLTGSIKDRVALYMITKAKERNELKEGMPIIEATSGNTGISLAALGKIYGHKVYIFMRDWVSKERVSLMKSYGAKVILISREEGGFRKCLEEAKTLAKKVNGFWTNQFSNQDNILAHYETTGDEISKSIQEEIGGFVSGVGTGGTLMGTSKKLKEKFLDMKTVAIEPEKMPMITEGKMVEQHKIEGIGDDFVPELFEKDKVNQIFLIDDDDAINMSKRLSMELGLGVGISSGANFLGSIMLGEETALPVVTVFPDDNKKYLSTELGDFSLKNSKKEFLSNQIKLIKFEMIHS